MTAGHKAILTFRWGGLNEIVAPAQWGETGWVLGRDSAIWRMTRLLDNKFFFFKLVSK